MSKHAHDQGFSLVELLIVVVIIGIIAAIAIPGFLASRRSANEGSAVSTLRLLHEAQMTYATSFGQGQYAGDTGTPNIVGLGVLRGRGMIDENLATGVKSGYSFVGARDDSGGNNAFFFSAIPVSPSGTTQTGDHRYGIASNGVIKTDTTLTSHYADMTAVSNAATFSR